MKIKQEFGDINLSTDNAYQVLNLFYQSFLSLPDRPPLNRRTQQNCKWTALKNRGEIVRKKELFF